MEDKMQSRGKTANPLAMLRVLSLAFAFAIILITLAGPYQSDGAQYGRSTPIYEPDRYGVEINDDDCDEHPDDEPPVEIEDDIGEATAGSDDYGPMDPAQLEINYESDENAEDTVSKEAIETNIVPCPNAKDPTCKFRDSCGRAPLNPLKNAAKGGSRRGQISPYTINGDRVETYGEWPSFVRLEKFSRKPPRGMEVCGGVLISDRHVLTAGYCAYWHEGKDLAKPEHFIAYLADHKANSNDTFEDEFDVKRICRSKRYAYSDDSKTDDWAIFELDQPVEKFNDHIQPACLPFEPIKRTGKSAQCWTMGYGLISQRRPDREESLWMHKMRVEQVSCRGFGLNDRDRSRECYAKAKRHQGTGCYEDWGNPVLCMDEKGRWTVTGVMSYFDDDPNYTCSGKGPAAWKTVFARVRTLLSDIKKECNI